MGERRQLTSPCPRCTRLAKHLLGKPRPLFFLPVPSVGCKESNQGTGVCWDYLIGIDNTPRWGRAPFRTSPTEIRFSIKGTCLCKLSVKGRTVCTSLPQLAALFPTSQPGTFSAPAQRTTIMSHLEKAENGSEGVPSLVNAQQPLRVPSRRLGNPGPLCVLSTIATLIGTNVYFRNPVVSSHLHPRP